MKIKLGFLFEISVERKKLQQNSRPRTKTKKDEPKIKIKLF